LDFLRKKNSRKRFGIFKLSLSKILGKIQFEAVDFMQSRVENWKNQEEAKILFQVIDSLSENQKTAFI